MKKRAMMSWALALTAVGAMLMTGCSTGTKSAAETEVSTEQASEEESSAAAQTDAAEADEDETGTTDIYGDFLQKRTQKTEFASFDEIIDSLRLGEGYAYIQVNGYDGDILAVTDFVYADRDGTYISTRASLYGEDQDGMISALAYPETGDTANPLYCDNGILYVCNLKQYGEMQFDDDGVLYFRKQVVVNDEAGGATFSGYTMLSRSESEDVNINSQEEFDELFEVLRNLTPITFTRVEYESYDAVIDHLQEGGCYAFLGVDGYDGELLAVSDDTLEYEFYGLKGTVAVSADIYAERDGKAEYVGMVATGGKNYPIRNSNGVLYIGNQAQYSEMKIRQNVDGRYELYDVRYAGIVYDEDGNASYEAYDLEDTDSSVAEVTDDASFQALFTALEVITPVGFWAQDSGFGR